ncbi:hypothetical protein TNCV_87221 [Trichonephila clavipes]|nr:hypothetical protein TNCV_87221 [Trichonephila clavipes]
MTAAKRTLRKLQRGSACCLITHTSPWCKLCKCCKKTTQANFTQTCEEHFKELEEKNSPPPTKNSPPSIKKSSPSTTNSPPPAKKKYFF